MWRDVGEQDYNLFELHLGVYLKNLMRFALQPCSDLLFRRCSLVGKWSMTWISDDSRFHSTTNMNQWEFLYDLILETALFEFPYVYHKVFCSFSLLFIDSRLKPLFYLLLFVKRIKSVGFFRFGVLKLWKKYAVRKVVLFVKLQL